MTLKDLQLRLIKHGLDAYLVTRSNMFINQDILDEENSIQNLTGFTGSNGKLLVFHNKVYLFTDGRYEIQAKNETDPEVTEVIICRDKHEFKKWLMKSSPKNKKLKIGYNPWCHTIKDVDDLKSAAANIFPHVSFIETDFFTPPFSTKQSLVFEHTVEFAGFSREEKISLISAYLQKNDLDAYFTSAADSVSWLLNIRSNCLPTTPIVRAMALINKNKNITIFGDNLNFELNFEANIKTLPLSAVEKELSKYKKKKVAFCFYQTPQKIKNFADKYKLLYQSLIDPCQEKKVCKSPVEIANIKKSHLRDGIVLSKFLCWVEKNATSLTELDVVNNLFEFRKIQENFFSNSFDTIAGFGSNGAIVHYRPSEQTNKNLENGSLLLIDSGAQYLDGTTDVTRTIAIGEPTNEMVEDFTIVLKAHIALISTIFPSMGGIKIDIIARRELWKHHKDYSHGTGHGVGYFLNVHEGPSSISPNGTHYALQENMLTSIEPGFYKEGEYGIRIENLALIKKEDDFLSFEPVTIVPIDKKLINIKMLNQEEKAWLNDYHQKIFEKLAPYMDAHEKVWLSNSCSPI